MNELIKIETSGERMTVSSREIAKNFGKEHYNVIRDIETLIGQMKNTELNFEFSTKNNRLNFEPVIKNAQSKIGLSTKNAETSQYFIKTEYKDASGKSNKAYKLTRDGFSLLVMGFTGQKALEWKLRYIEAFNEMERRLINGASVRQRLPYKYMDKTFAGIRVYTLTDFKEQFSISNPWEVMARAKLRKGRDCLKLKGQELREFKAENPDWPYRNVSVMYILTTAGWERMQKALNPALPIVHKSELQPETTRALSEYVKAKTKTADRLMNEINKLARQCTECINDAEHVLKTLI